MSENPQSELPQSETDTAPQVAIFDLDGTLIRGYMDLPDKDYTLVELLPGRVERLAALRAAGVRVAIATNQGGVGLGIHSEDAFWAKIVLALALLGLPEATHVNVCFAHERSKSHLYNDPAEAARRKPAPAMLLEILDLYAIPPQRALFVGDRPEDEQAAQAAGVPFIWAEEYFK